ncbi:MAG: hypothetical protein HKN21_11330, partial [Candidatus Eisenbacteria bacterium]|nr:hypothetical protein [Candidatus Eisenbacteria bacterium]
MQPTFQKLSLVLLAISFLFPLSKNANAQEEEVESRDSKIRAAEFIINNVPPGALIVIEENALGPYWESLSEGSYLTLTIPKDEENPILVSPLYNLQWYGDLD